MAEEQRIWSQRHTHESNIVSYGQFGTPTYYQSSADWVFLRQDVSTNTNDKYPDTRHDDQGLFLKIITTVETVVEAATSHTKAHGILPLCTDLAQLAPAASLIKAFDGMKPRSPLVSHKGHLIAFGSAVWLGSDGVDSGSSTVPVVAFATGNTGTTLELTCLGREQIEYTSNNGAERKVRVPFCSGDVRTSTSATEPILQIAFSQQDISGKGNTFLLVRRLTHTTVFEPLLRRDSSVGSPAQTSSSLDLNPLIVINSSLTGGHAHVDSMFHPLNHRLLAIVDEEGNWSTWVIHGRRSTTARVLYQAQLETSGKIFSWQYGKRPPGIGLFFDGWHKAVWLSSSRQNIDRLLVCNRQTIRVFDTAGEAICSIDARLDLGGSMSILDVQIGPLLNICLVLTTARLLVFDLAQQEWKDPVNDKGPSLVCGFQHFYGLASLSLRMTWIMLGDKMLVALSSTSSQSFDLRSLSLYKKNDALSITISDPQQLKLPLSTLDSQVAAVTFTRSEYVRTGGDPTPLDEQLIYVVIQREDLSIQSFWITVAAPSSAGIIEIVQNLLKLPPNRSVHSKRYADDTHDDDEEEEEEEDDIERFITSDDGGDVFWQKGRLVSQPALSSMVVRNREMKKASMIADAISQQSINRAPQLALKITEILERLDTRFHDTGCASTEPIKCDTLSNLLDGKFRVQEIEAESDAIHQALKMPNPSTRSYAISQCHGKSAQTLLGTHNSLIDTFVESLPTDVPDRFRVQKERQLRQISLEQYFSSRTVHHAQKEIDTGLGGGQEIAESSQIIFSDPIHGDVSQNQYMKSISASQPLPETNSELCKSKSEATPLLDSISRLRTFTKIGRGLESHLAKSTTLDGLLSVLGHIPASCDDDPGEYGYQATLMSTTADKDEIHGIDVKTSNSRAQRKTARLAKARKRAEASTPAVGFSASGAYDKEVGNNNRDAVSGNTGMLPIRSAGGNIPGVAWSDSWGQRQDRHVFSDGHIAAGIPISGATYGGFTHTQPEKGAFASRVQANGQSKSKKKRRVAGF